MKKIFVCTLGICFLLYFILLNLTDLKIKFMIGKKSNQVRYHSTLVSGYFDINRVGRPREEYFEWLRETQKLNAPLVLFIQRKYEKNVSDMFQNRNFPYLIIPTELNDLYFYKDIEKVSKIIASSDYKSRISESNRIECSNPLYSIVIFSKFYLMNRTAQMNPFNSEKFIWMDAGISRFYAGFNLSLPINGTRIPNDKYFIIFETTAYSDPLFINKDANNLLWGHKSFVLAGIMGGTLELISKVTNLMERQWNRMISNNVINNEQIALILSYFEEPGLFRLFNRTMLPGPELKLKEIFSFLSV